MAETLDGCAEFDERLIENVFAPSPDAELDRHVASCARCRKARERYLAASDALAGALAAPPGAAAPVRAPRSIRRRLLLAAVAAAAVLLAIAFVRARLEPSISVRAIEGEVSRAEGRDAYRLDRGTAQFVVERGPLVVETPLGVARCEEGDFTLAVAEEEGSDSMNAKHAALAVTITVAAGVVWWTAGGDEIAVEPGAPHVERERPEREGDAAGLGLLEPGKVPPGSVQREPVADESTPIETASPDGSPDPTFEILGRVVDGETAQPIAGAAVRLGTRRPDGRTFAAQGASGEDGAFRAASAALSGADPDSIAAHLPYGGNYLRVDAEGFAPISEIPWRLGVVDSLAATRPIDLGEIRIWRGAEVSGRVTAGSGAPVSDAVVLLAEDVRVTSGVSFSAAQAREAARTLEDGTFVLARRVAPAKPSSGKTFLFAVSSRGLGWTEIDVLEAKREVRDVEIPIGAAARLEVLVQGDDRRPIEGAEIWAEPRFAPLVFTMAGPQKHDRSMWFGYRDDVRAIFTATTDSNGRARFDRLPVPETGGRYDLVVNAKGFTRTWKDDVNVDPSTSASAVVAMETYRSRAVSGSVRDEGRVPIAGATVLLYVGGRRERAETDALGAFRLEGVDPSASAAWFVVTVPGFVEYGRSLPLPGPGDVAGIEIELAKPSPIAGRIVDQDGRPVAGARPHLHRENDFRPFRGEQGMTNEDGAFRFDDATAGEWHLQINAPTPEKDWAAAYSNFTVEGGDTSIEIVLTRAESSGARVVVEIVDASGEPLDPSAALLWRVGAWPERGRKSLPQVARGVGRATAEAVDPGAWRIWVRASGQATAYADFRVEPGQNDVSVRVEVRPAGTLAGRVLFDERVPFRRVWIDARVGDGVVPQGPEWSGGGASVGYANLEVPPDGSFRIENATPGRWWLSMRGAGALGSSFVDVPSGGEGRAEIHPTVGGRIQLRGTDVVPDAQIEIEIAEGEQGVWTRDPGPLRYEGRPFEHEITVRPGRVRWRVGFKKLPSSIGQSATDAAFPQEGELRIDAGKVEEILVPVVLKD